MKLGAQFFTLRERCKTPEALHASFAAMKEIGYDNAQMSAICQIEPERLRSYVEEFDLPITCTHSPFDRIVNDTDALIREHQIYGCPVIGLGMMPGEYHGSLEAARTFLHLIDEPMKKIEAAGLHLAYHNHAFEFKDLEGTCLYDLLIEEAPSLHFILDTYWVKYAGRDVFHYLDLFGSSRMTNIHFKDMRTEPEGEICPCGAGVIDFAPIIARCDALGIPNALVEQDNAPTLGDEYEQMRFSYEHLAPLFGERR